MSVREPESLASKHRPRRARREDQHLGGVELAPELASGESGENHAESKDDLAPVGNGGDSAEAATIEDIVAFTEARLRETLTQIETLKHGAQSAKVRLEAELQVQRRRAANAEDRLRQAEAQLKQTRDELEAQSITCAELTTVLRATEHRLNRLEEGAREGKSVVLRDVQSVELERLRAEREQLEARLNEAKKEAAAARERFNKDIDTLAAERFAVATKLDALQVRLSERGDECNRLSAELQRASEAKAALEAQVRQLTVVQTQSAQEISELHARQVQLEAALTSAKERETARNEESRRLTARCGALERELTQRRDDGESLRRERNELQAMVDALIAEREEARREIARQQNAQQQAAEQCGILERRLGELERAAAAARDHESVLQKTVTELQELLQKEQAGAATLRAELQNQARIRQSLEIELAEARARSTELQFRLQSDQQQHQAQLAKANERSRALESERNQLQAQLVEATSAKERIEREMDHLRRKAAAERQQEEMERLRAKLEEVAWAHPDARRQPVVANPNEKDIKPAVAASSRAAEEDICIIAIGASTGGPAALGEILPNLPADFPACILIVQHMPPGYTAELAFSLDQRSAISVVEARHGDSLRAGVAFIAPGGHHMEVRGGTIRLTAGPPVNKHRPSVDVLYDSLVSAAKRVYAVLLSGMGHDGVAGMARLRAAGADTVVQDEATSVVWGMPGAAVKAGCSTRQLPPAEVTRYLIEQIVSREARAQSALPLASAAAR